MNSTTYMNTRKELIIKTMVTDTGKTKEYEAKLAALDNQYINDCSPYQVNHKLNGSLIKRIRVLGGSFYYILANKRVVPEWEIYSLL